MAVASDKSALGAFLRSRRQALSPEDLGLYRGPRRRADGLRLTRAELDYLFTLCGRAPGAAPAHESAVYRWFTDPVARRLYLPGDYDYTGRALASLLRDDFVRHGNDSLAGQVMRALLAQSPEFAGLWARAEIGLRLASEKRLEHPEVGRLDVYCQTLSDTQSGQALLIYTATPGSKSHERLALLGVIGSDFPRS